MRTTRAESPVGDDRAGSGTDAARLAFCDAVVDATSDAALQLDGAGIVRSCNRSAERIFGRTAAELVDRPVQALFPAGGRDAIDWLLDVVASGDRIEQHAVDVHRKGGMTTPISLTLQPLRDATGAVVGIAAVARDLTEQRLAQATLAETEARRRESEARAHVGRWLWDVGTGAVQWSEELHRIHGVDPWDFGGDLEAHVATVAPCDRDRVVRALEEAVALGRALEEDYEIVHPGPTPRRVACRAEPALGAHGRVVGLRGTIRATG